jgi:hypothetical protein
VLELQGGLPTGREALRPSEPHHSPDKATPSYYTKNENFASGISKMWSSFTGRGAFIGPWGSSTDLAEAVTHQVVAGQQMSSASTNFLHRHSLPIPM